MPYRVTKTFGHDLGLSCCFRQWRSTHSHCCLLHGYAIAVQLVFEADELDERNWVIDFGGFRKIKDYLADTFDHKLIVAVDDPLLDDIIALGRLGIAQVVVMNRVGCEAFSAEIAEVVQGFLEAGAMAGRVRLVSVEVQEHGANAAAYMVPND